MEMSVVFLAEYDSYDEAQACTEFLQDEGIDSRMDYNSSQNLFEVYVSADQKGWAEYLLDENEVIVESDYQVEDTDIEVEPLDKAHHFILVGSVIAMVGIITSLGSFESVPKEFILFPYSLVAIGSYAFLRGILMAREDEE